MRARRRKLRLGLLAGLWLLPGCAPSLDAMRASTVRVLCRVDAQISTGSGWVPRAENIAWAIHIDALLPGLRALGLPFTVVEPGPLEPLARLARREPVAAAVLTLLLGLAATGGLWAYRRPGGRPASQPPGAAPPRAARPFRPQLRGLSGPFAGNVLELPEGAVALGRDPRRCQLVFPAECAEIGRQHALLRFDAQADQFLLEDCGSHNGTFLEAGERLPPHQPQRLPPGTRFYLGDRRYRFEVGLAKP